MEMNPELSMDSFTAFGIDNSEWCKALVVVGAATAAADTDDPPDETIPPADAAAPLCFLC